MENNSKYTVEERIILGGMMKRKGWTCKYDTMAGNYLWSYPDQLQSFTSVVMADNTPPDSAIDFAITEGHIKHAAD